MKSLLLLTALFGLGHPDGAALEVEDGATVYLVGPSYALNGWGYCALVNSRLQVTNLNFNGKWLTIVLCSGGGDMERPRPPDSIGCKIEPKYEIKRDAEDHWRVRVWCPKPAKPCEGDEKECALQY